jgi:hypothetical protein
MGNGHPVTRPELREEMATLREEMATDKAELMASMRQIETNLLTAFHGYARGVSAHLHDLDTGQHDIKIRLSALEDRILNLETRRPL